MYSLLVIGIGKSSLSQWLFLNSTPRANIYIRQKRGTDAPHLCPEVLGLTHYKKIQTPSVHANT